MDDKIILERFRGIVEKAVDTPSAYNCLTMDPSKGLAENGFDSLDQISIYSFVNVDIATWPDGVEPPIKWLVEYFGGGS